MQAIFTRTQKIVVALLQPLSGNAVTSWQAGVDQLSIEFEASLADVKKKIDDRHSGVFGGLTEFGDDMFGLPSWVTMDYDIAETKLADGATRLITDISRNVNQVIEDCKKLIEQARKDIEAIVNSLPVNLQTWAHDDQDDDLDQRGLDRAGDAADVAGHGLRCRADQRFDQREDAGRVGDDHIRTLKIASTDFLAGYIGLGSLGAKLKGVIMKLSGKLKAALTQVLHQDGVVPGRRARSPDQDAFRDFAERD